MTKTARFPFNMLSRLSRKNTPPGAPCGTALFSLAEARWGSRGQEALARDGYIGNVVAFRSIRLVAECAASVPLLARRSGVPVGNDPALYMLERPNGEEGRQDFFERIYCWLQIAGNAFIERTEAADGVARALHLLRPDRMHVLTGPSGWPEGYEFRLRDFVKRFPLETADGRAPILHLKTFHPLDDHRGHAALRTAASAIEIHNAASDWNKALLDNAARPSGALIFEPRDGMPDNLSEAQLARLREEMAAQFQGGANAGRPLLLEGGLKWQQMAFSPADMDFIDLKHVAAREIALAFGVPPMLLGIPGDNTFANYQEANRALWRLTILPLVERTLTALARWLGQDDAGDLTLHPDRDAIPALAAEREALWARVGAATFLTPNEQRAAVGLGPLPGGDGLGQDSGGSRAR
ncbi:MAG: phage portal protein [Rhodothalassiaceae bacterium]